MHNNPPRIALQGIDGLMFVQALEIVHAQADGNYTIVSLSQNRSIKVLRQLKEVEDLLLPFDNFIRVHRSHLLNIEHVIRLESDSETILMTDGTSIPLARDRKMEFIENFTRI